MIGFNALGQLGRLGNQMFQFAALKGIARHHGYQFCFPPSENKNEWTDHQLLIPFKMSSTNALNIQYIDPDRPNRVRLEGCTNYREVLRIITPHSMSMTSNEIHIHNQNT